MKKLNIEEHKKRIKVMIDMVKKDPNVVFLDELYILCNFPKNYLNTRIKGIGQLKQLVKDLYDQLEENKLEVKKTKLEVKEEVKEDNIRDKAQEYNRANQKYLNFLKYGRAESPEDLNKTPHLLDLYKLG